MFSSCVEALCGPLSMFSFVYVVGIDCNTAIISNVGSPAQMPPPSWEYSHVSCGCLTHFQSVNMFYLCIKILSCLRALRRLLYLEAVNKVIKSTQKEKSVSLNA